MMEKLDIGICGGGNLAHAMAAFLAVNGHRCHILTRYPQQWATALTARMPDGSMHIAPLKEASADPAILTSCQLILISVPRYALSSICKQIFPYLNENQTIAIIPGSPAILEMQKEGLWQKFRLCAYYKVPFICRAAEYGHRVSLLGSRALNRIWLSRPEMEKDLPIFEDIFQTPLRQLSSAWPFLLTNSNPLLHPSRLLVMFKNYSPGIYYDRNFLFYEEWTDESSALYIQADNELLSICDQCPGMKIGVDIIPVTEYYESPTPEALTRKINSIEAFKGITSPMLKQTEGWIPDFNSRYFTEDIRWGTKPICRYARQLHIDTPTLDSFVNWTERLLKLN